MADLDSFPTELKMLRLEQDLTQEEAAEECGYSIGAWQSWEQGRHTPSATKMDYIRSVLGSDEEDALADLDSFPAELKMLRLEQDLTQGEAAEECGYSTGTWQSWEQGRHTPSAKKMDHIRSVLGSDEEDAMSDSHAPGSVDHRTYEIPVPHPVGDRQTLVVDRREAERQYGDALGKVRAHRVRSSSMEGVVDRGAWVEYVTDTGYQGPGMYLLSLTGERPWPAYFRKLSPVEMEIKTTNREAPIRLVREGPDAEWAHEDGGEVDFVLHGICERWDQNTVDL